MKVLVTRYVPECCMDFLREQGYEVIHTNDTSEGNICSLVTDVDAILSRELTTTKKILESAPNLKIIARFGLGTDMIDMKTATERGVWVSITPEASPRSVAEHAMTLLLASAKNISVSDKQVHNNNWLFRNARFGCDVKDKTLGLIGFGRIGRAMAEMASAFSMNVLAYDLYVSQDQAPAGVTMVPTLEELLNTSDFVSLHCPATEETRNIINEATLKAMKPNSYLINTARGTLVDEDALYNALVSGHLRGAASDVSQLEPPKADNPLLQLDNFILTPHIAAITDEAMWRMGMHAAWCIDDVLSGKPPRWPANDPVRSGSAGKNL